MHLVNILGNLNLLEQMLTPLTMETLNLLEQMLPPLTMETLTTLNKCYLP